MSSEVLQRGQQAAQAIYRATGCSALSRIDFFLKSDGTWVFNEINPMPGLTPMSVYPAIWKAEGYAMEEVMDQIVIASLYRGRMRQKHLRPPEAPPVEL
jgi:D-alanine-D-alanine ligase